MTCPLPTDPSRTAISSRSKSLVFVRQPLDRQAANSLQPKGVLQLPHIFSARPQVSSRLLLRTIQFQRSPAMARPCNFKNMKSSIGSIDDVNISALIGFKIICLGCGLVDGLPT